MKQFIIGFVACLLFASLYSIFTSYGFFFVSGKHGTVCYVAGQEPKNIKEKVYHNSIKECLQYIR